MIPKSWRLTISTDRCGFDDQAIAPGEPVQVLQVALGVSRLRCQQHAIGGIDHEAIAQLADGPSAEPITDRSEHARRLRPLAEIAPMPLDWKSKAAGE